MGAGPRRAARQTPAPGLGGPARRCAIATALFTAVLALPGCGGDAAGPEAPSVASLVVEPDRALLVGVGDTLTFRARALDGRGARVSGVAVTWSVDDASVASVDAAGRVEALATGETVLRASGGGAEGTARLEVWVAPEVESWEPGISYWGRARYVEYVPGTLPLLVSAPHGGDLEPAEIPDRTSGTTVTDLRTRETLAALKDALVERTGHAPHVVISHLRRTKLDPNREIGEAAQGNPYAEQAWREFQGFIETARATVEEDHGRGLYLDLHGHGHDIQRAELGYLLSSAELALEDEELDAGGHAAESSIRALAQASPRPFSELLRGPASLGSLMQDRGLASVPSDIVPSPGTAPYFSGGYNTRRHGSREEGEVVDGVQVELNWTGVRDTPESRSAFGARMAETLEEFMEEHYGFFAPAGTAGSRAWQAPEGYLRSSSPGR